MRPIFITGIGTDVGKTVVSAIVAEALEADYWKPIQAGFEDGTDSQKVQQLLSNKQTIIHPEAYKLVLPASPHIAAREENISIDIEKIIAHYHSIQQNNRQLIIEGAGGLMVPINEHQFMLDLIKALDAFVIIVSKNYLGSINHSLLTTQVCRYHQLKVLGLVFNGEYMNYQQEVIDWSGYAFLESVPTFNQLTKEAIERTALQMKAAIEASIKSYHEETGT